MAKRTNRVAWGLVGVLAVVLTVSAGVGLHYIHHHPGAIQVGNTIVSYGPNWGLGFREFRRVRSGVVSEVFARVLYLGPLTVAILPRQAAAPTTSTRSGTGAVKCERRESERSG